MEIIKILTGIALIGGLMIVGAYVVGVVVRYIEPAEDDSLPY